MTKALTESILTTTLAKRIEGVYLQVVDRRAQLNEESEREENGGGGGVHDDDDTATKTAAPAAAAAATAAPAAAHGSDVVAAGGALAVGTSEAEIDADRRRSTQIEGGAHSPAGGATGSATGSATGGSAGAAGSAASPTSSSSSPEEEEERSAAESERRAAMALDTLAVFSPSKPGSIPKSSNLRGSMSKSSDLLLMAKDSGQPRMSMADWWDLCRAYTCTCTYMQVGPLQGLYMHIHTHAGGTSAGPALSLRVAIRRRNPSLRRTLTTCCQSMCVTS